MYVISYARLNVNKNQDINNTWIKPPNLESRVYQKHISLPHKGRDKVYIHPMRSPRLQVSDYTGYVVVVELKITILVVHLQVKWIASPSLYNRILFMRYFSEIRQKKVDSSKYMKSILHLK